MAAWVLPIICSALTLGVYDVCKKHAVRENQVMPVLFLATCSGTLFFMLLTGVRGDFPRILWTREILLLSAVKSLIVGASWACVYYGLRELPVSIAAPLRSTSPLWCIIGAVIIFGEIPRGFQYLGMILIFSGGLLFTLIGVREHFSWHSAGVLLTVAGTIIGAGSAIFDKFLLGTRHIPPVTLQFHFSWILVVVLGAAFLFRCLLFPAKGKFRWRWSIAVTGVLLIIADALYFYALSLPETRISILSFIRRSSVVTAFALGGGLFHEKLLLPKAAALAVILAGVAVLSLCG